MVTTRETKEIIMTTYFKEVRDLIKRYVMEYGNPKTLAERNNVTIAIMENVMKRYHKKYHLIFYYQIEENPEDSTNPGYCVTHILDEETGIVQTAEEWITKNNLPNILPKILQ